MNDDRSSALPPSPAPSYSTSIGLPTDSGAIAALVVSSIAALGAILGGIPGVVMGSVGIVLASMHFVTVSNTGKGGP